MSGRCETRASVRGPRGRFGGIRHGRGSGVGVTPPSEASLPGGPSDQELLAGLGRSDPQASAAFIELFQRRVFGLAKSIVADPQQAEDIAQEAFVRAWRHAGSYDSQRGPVSAWLLPSPCTSR